MGKSKSRIHLFEKEIPAIFSIGVVYQSVCVCNWSEIVQRKSIIRVCMMVVRREMLLGIP